MDNEGWSLLELAKDLKIRPKRLLSWEYDGHFCPVFRRKGRRLVRLYPPSLTETIRQAVVLIERGYGVRMGFYMAKRGETPPVGEAR